MNDADLRRFAALTAVWTDLAHEPAAAGFDSATASRSYMGMQAAERALVARGEWTNGPSTLMSVLGIARREVANCRVVTWLLDPLARHGIGARMITALGAAIGVELPHPQRARAHAEVSRSNSRADVVVAGVSWTIVIEAKINAGEGLEQASRLEEDWLPDGPSTVLVFLTRSGARRPRTATQPSIWKTLSWISVASAAEGVLSSMPPAPKGATAEARHAVLEWAATVRAELT
jgi:hypothetical protein